MFPLTSSHQKTEFELGLAAQPGTCNGMKTYVKEHKADFHNLFASADDQDGNLPSHNGFSLALRLMVQDFKNDESRRTETIDTREFDQIQTLDELLSPGLNKSFGEIIELIETQTQLQTDEPYQPIGIDSNELGDLVDEWTTNLIQELEQTRSSENPMTENDRHQIQGQVDFFFGSLLDLRNSEAFVKEIQEFFRDNPTASQGRKKLIEDLESRYPLNRRQVSQLVEIVEPNRYGLSQICNILKMMGKEYGLSNKKGQLVGTSMRFAAVSLASSLSSYARQSALGVPVGNCLMRLATSIRTNAEKNKIELLRDMKKELNQRVADSLMMKEFGDMDESKFAEIHTALTRGKGASYSLLSNLIGQMLPQSVEVGASLGFMGLLHPALGVASISSLPLILRSASQFLPKFEDFHRLEKEAEQVNAQSVQSITNSAEDVLISPNPDLIADTLKTGLNEQDDLSIEIDKLNIDMQHSFGSLFWNAMIGSSLIGVGLWNFEQITGGEVFASSAIAAGVQNPFINLIGRSTEFLTDLQQVQEMEEMLQAGEGLSLAEDAKKPGVSLLTNHDIEIKDLDFTGDNEQSILKDINLKIPQGSFMTITGRSGEGKSTLMKCLLGLYKPSNGSVSIGGVSRGDLRQNGKDSVKSMISACSQRPTYLAHKTLRENLLLYSKESLSDKKIQATLDQLGLSEFRDRLDEKLARPSGGQRLRIGLASALLRGNGETKILVLDEPTSGLDFETAGEITNSLKQLHQDRKDLTIVCVTHSKEVRDTVNNNFDLSTRT